VNQDVTARVCLAQDVRALEVAPRAIELTFLFGLPRALELRLECRS